MSKKFGSEESLDSLVRKLDECYDWAVMLLAEMSATICTSVGYDERQCKNGHTVFNINIGNNSYPMGMIVNKKIRSSVYRIQPTWRSFGVEFRTNRGRQKIICSHLKHGGEWVESLDSAIGLFDAKIKAKDHVWVGDFNKVLGKDLGKNVLGPWAGDTSGKGAESLFGFLEAKGLRETTTFSSKWAGAHTWQPTGDQPGTASRIDHIIAHKQHAQKIADSSKITWWDILGDHAILSFVWDVGGIKVNVGGSNGGAWQCKDIPKFKERLKELKESTFEDYQSLCNGIGPLIK